MRKGNKSGWLTLVFTSSVDDGCIQRNMQNQSTIAWLQEGVTSCRRVRVDFERLKTLKRGDRLALLPGHGVSSFAPMSSILVLLGSRGVISWYYRITKTVKIIPNHILQTRWPLSSRETLRKRLVEESPSPSPLVRSTTLSSIQRPEKHSIVMCYASVHAQHFNYWIISLSLYWKGDGGEANVVVSKSGDRTKKTNSDKNQDVSKLFWFWAHACQGQCTAA